MPAPLEDPWRIPFRVRDAREAGVPDGRLRRRDLRRTFRGIRALPWTDDVRAFLPLLRDGERFSHATAAAAWSAPLPQRMDGELHVSVDGSFTRTRHPGVVGHRTSHTAAVVRNGLPVSTPIDLVIELAGSLGLEDLVAVVDHLVLVPHVHDPSDPRPYVALDELRGLFAARHDRNIRVAREAADLARVGSASRRETWLRLLAADAGLPEPECNVELRDAAGRIGFFDLVWRRWRVASEYDGDQHRFSPAQYEKDILRFDRAAAIGWSVVRVRNAGYRDPADTRRRLLEAFRAHGWRPGLDT